MGSTSCERFLTSKARSTPLDGIRKFYQNEGPGTVSFLAGRPNFETFPITELSVTFKQHPEDDETVTAALQGTELRTALQYGSTNGVPQLRSLLEQYQQRIHKRKPGGWSVIVGNGSQDLLWKMLNATLDTGDTLLCETPMYAGALAGVHSLDINCVEVTMDEQGLSASGFERVLSTWPSDQKKPRVLYTNPVGGNPTGISATVDRKLEILALCIKHDILILEDDPYYFLTPKLVPSYFELEAVVSPDGPWRVARFDSFSKILSGGMRLGYLSAPTELLLPIEVQTATINLHTSTLCQMLVHKLLVSWGLEGFLATCYATAMYYKRQREMFVPLARARLGGLATWQDPTGGFFLWIDCSPSGVVDSTEFMYSHAIPKGVLACPGTSFMPSHSVSSHLRLSFSEVSTEEAENGLQKLGEALSAYKKEHT